ncbi:hypothetical protein C0992_006759, partial [Termitomyces sp. T32_za158]
DLLDWFAAHCDSDECRANRVGNSVDEKSSFGTEDRVGGEKSAGLGDVREEFEKDERFGEFYGLGGRAVWRGNWASISNGRDLRKD